jgi:ribosome-associated toxin RatA of RatAB toxin-antitoxin module
VLSRDEHVVVATIDIRYSGLRHSFTTRNTLRRDSMMDMQLVDGPFSHLNGCWRFDALDERACKISLDLDFAAAKGALNMMIAPVFTRIANQMVGGFHQRAAQLYGVRT